MSPASAQMAHEPSQRPGHDEQGYQGDDEGQRLDRALSFLDFGFRLVKCAHPGAPEHHVPHRAKAEPGQGRDDDGDIVDGHVILLRGPRSGATLAQAMW
jgi:hypothetical protein